MNRNKIAKEVFLILGLEQNPGRNSIFNMYYDSVKNEVLREKVWKFALCQKKLKPFGKYGDNFLYVYPQDCLFVMNVGSDKFNEKFNECAKCRLIYTHLPSAEIVYIKRLEDRKISDKLFIKAFCLALASVLSARIKDDDNLACKLAAEYDRIINLEKLNTEAENG